MKPDTSKLITEFADGLRPSIEHLESLPPASENHVNMYRTFLAQNPADQRLIVAAALLEAGATNKSVAEAMKFLGIE